MAVQATHLTAQDLECLPDDDKRYELVRGELRIMPKGTVRHGRIAAIVGGLLWEHTQRTNSGITLAADPGFLLERDPDTVRSPDASFISSARVEAVGEATKFWPGAPDLAVEVVSPNDRPREVREKALEWLAGGSIAVLVLDPAERKATVYSGDGDAHVYGVKDTLDLGDAVPGFSIVVAELFA